MRYAFELALPFPADPPPKLAEEQRRAMRFFFERFVDLERDIVTADITVQRVTRAKLVDPSLLESALAPIVETLIELLSKTEKEDDTTVIVTKALFETIADDGELFDEHARIVLVTKSATATGGSA